LKLKYDEPLSNDAFNVNLRRYSVDIEKIVAMCKPKGCLVCIDGTFATPCNSKAGWCKLKPVLKSPAFSA
jgi:cystathionine beta-lyase/cystathionine gamma-synthase